MAMPGGSSASPFRWDATTNARLKQALSDAGGIERYGDKGFLDVIHAELGGNEGGPLRKNLSEKLVRMKHIATENTEEKEERRKNDAERQAKKYERDRIRAIASGEVARQEAEKEVAQQQEVARQWAEKWRQDEAKARRDAAEAEEAAAAAHLQAGNQQLELLRLNLSCPAAPREASVRALLADIARRPALGCLMPKLWALLREHVTNAEPGVECWVMTLLPELLAALAPLREGFDGAVLIDARLAMGLAEEQLSARAGVPCCVHLLRGEDRAEAEACLERHCAYVAETRDREAAADLINAYNLAAKSHGRPLWKGDDEFHRFSNYDDATHWGPERCLLVMAMLPAIAARIPGLVACVPAADVASARDRLNRLVPTFFGSLPDFENHVLSSAEAAGRGAASANFVQELSLEVRPMAAYFSATRLLDSMLGKLVCIDSTEHPVLVDMVSGHTLHHSILISHSTTRALHLASQASHWRRLLTRLRTHLLTYLPTCSLSYAGRVRSILGVSRSTSICRTRSRCSRLSSLPLTSTCP